MENDKFAPTPHNEGQIGDFAKTVLMPGDPLRAKFIAEHYLENVKQVNGVRNMLAYTGSYHGKEVTVMGSGMGMPSIAIYAYELFAFYGVDNIIRVGSCGSYQKDIDVFDVIIAQGSCTDSNFAAQYNLGGTFSAICSFDLLEKAVNAAREQKVNFHVGNIMASDHFYGPDPKAWTKWAAMGVLGVEMESYALYTVASTLGKKALAIDTVSDSFISHKVTTSKEREDSFTQMIEIALAIL